jgi:membrane associated rhomboid family serine protease
MVLEVVVVLRSSSRANPDNQPWTHDNMVRFLGLTLVVGVMLSLVTTQPDTKYVTPVVGLLGAVAGYFMKPSP